jgi:hypothetical protein
MEMSDYEKRVLAATPGKALTFLRATATKVGIRAALFPAGYTPQEQEVGWSWLQRASGYVPGVGSVEDDATARAAIAEVDAWDEPGFRRIGAALQRLHPEQHAFVFAGLEAARGAGALLTVATLLDRLDALAKGRSSATEVADRQALATLNARGITPELRSHLRGLIAAAQVAATPALASNPSAEDRAQALLELRAWYKDWSETARAVISRKDYLIMLGLSKRRSSGSAEVDEVLETEVGVDSETPADAIPAAGRNRCGPARPDAYLTEGAIRGQRLEVAPIAEAHWGSASEARGRKSPGGRLRQATRRAGDRTERVLRRRRTRRRPNSRKRRAPVVPRRRVRTPG